MVQWAREDLWPWRNVIIGQGDNFRSEKGTHKIAERNTLCYYSNCFVAKYSLLNLKIFVQFEN